MFEDVGMRLNVGSWLTEWMCREEGVQWQSPQQKCNKTKLVIAEPLQDAEKSHVDAFLRDHDGPGLQHLG